MLYHAIYRQSLPECMLLLVAHQLSRVAHAQSQYAAVMDLNENLKLEFNEFSNAATWFFTIFLIAEVPNGIVLQKVPVAK